MTRLACNRHDLPVTLPSTNPSLHNGLAVISISDQIDEAIGSGNLELAYDLGRAGLQQFPDDQAIMNAMFALTAQLREQCIGLAVLKMDAGASYLAKEALLRRINALTGEDMYGRIGRQG